MVRRKRSSSLGFGLFALGGVASRAGGCSAAGGAGPHRGTGWRRQGEGYGYEFTDDPLTAGGFGPNDATIRVRPGRCARR